MSSMSSLVCAAVVCLVVTLGWWKIVYPIINSQRDKAVNHYCFKGCKKIAAFIHYGAEGFIFLVPVISIIGAASWRYVSISFVVLTFLLNGVAYVRIR